MKPVGTIEGSGFYELLENPRMFIHSNKYGRSLEIFEGMIQGRRVYFLPRYGEEHKITVSRINYRANIWVFKELGVEQILATNCVGSSNPDIELGSLVVPHDFCDWTKRFPRSSHDDEMEAYHVGMTSAYCPDLRKVLTQVANQVKPGHAHDQAVASVNKGLRFETPFELKMFRRLGADLIGMTALLEVMLAREAAIYCVHICVPTSWYLGEQIEADDLPGLLKQGIEDFRQVLYLVIPTLSDDRDCLCSHTLDHAVLKERGVEQGCPDIRHCSRIWTGP